MVSRIVPSDARLYVVAKVLDTVLGGASRLGRLHPNAKPERHHVEHIADLRYVDGSTSRDHLLDVWRPSASAADLAPGRSRRHRGPPWPIVFYVHGGGFTICSKDSHWMMALAFARRGFIVFNVSYRLAPKHPFPAAVEDVFRAFDWTVKNAARFGGDTSRIVLAGESAGANLVTGLSIGLTYERPESFARPVFDTGIVPSAVVPACGLMQVSDQQRFVRAKPHIPWYVAQRFYEVETAYLGRGPWTCSLDLANPLCFLERGEKPARPLPPFFLPVGTHDPLLPDTRRIGAALRTLGADAVERYYPGQRHAFHTTGYGSAAKECWADTFAFLDKHVPFDV